MLTAAVLSLTCEAQSDTAMTVRPATSMFQFSLGRSSQVDTYISPVNYSGMNIGIGYEHLQATAFSPHRWIRQLEIGTMFHNLKNPVRNRNNYTLSLYAKWALMRRWDGVFTPRLSLMVGPETGVFAQMAYKPSNSNNVVAAKFHFDVGIQGMATFRTSLLGRQITLRAQTSVPVAGLYYSPEFDESYYEMYVGNRSGLVHFASWANVFAIRNAFTADIRLGGTILRLGYVHSHRNSLVEKITFRQTSHSFVLGIGGEFLSLRHPATAATFAPVSAIY